MTSRQRNLTSLALFLAIAALVILIVGGGQNQGDGGGGDSAENAPTTPAVIAPERTTPESEARETRIRFTRPKGTKGLTVERSPGVEEYRFTVGDYAARVRVQPAYSDDTLVNLQADYSSQGTAKIVTLGGERGVLVTSPSPPYVSLLFVTVEGQQLRYTQVLSRSTEAAGARALIGRIHPTIKVSGNTDG